MTQPSLRLDHPPWGPGSHSTGEGIPPSKPQFPRCKSRPRGDPPPTTRRPLAPRWAPRFSGMRPGLCLLTPGPSAHPARSAGPPVPALLPTPFTCRSRRRRGVGPGPCWSRREPPQAEGEAHRAWVTSAQGQAPGSWLRFPVNRPQGRVCSRSVASLGGCSLSFPLSAWRTPTHPAKPRSCASASGAPSCSPSDITGFVLWPLGALGRHLPMAGS